MAIPDSDPRAKDLDAAFAAAATGPQKPRAEAKTPVEVDRDAPHGRGEDGAPLAPYGLTKDGRVKITNAGRRPGNPDQPRTGPAPADEHSAPQAGKTAPPAPHDWTGDLDALADSAWFGLSAAAAVIPHVPFVGKVLPEKKLAAQAFILSETKPSLVAAVNLAAQHNAKAARFCRSLEGGDGLWALTCMFMVLPVISVSATIWKGDEAGLKDAELPTMAEMAERNGKKMNEAVAEISARIQAATEAATITGEIVTDPGPG
jgi:hypothetical protein